ncbi:MAG: hypothetical protein QOI77_2140 [Blastocatellia bacterium]|nr:hypothetical protein [Blastocatellia bacterium]
MNKTKSTLSFLAAFLFVITCATAGQASAQRTFVAGPGIGNDSNTASDCSFSAPCRNFSAAYTVTNTGGEIIALTPGVGYGALTITHAITVTGLPGQVAFVAVAASTSGFTVSAGTTDLVVVQNISFNGSGAGSTTGLTHNSGRLVVRNCVFQQLTIGVDNFAKMDLEDCEVHGNGTGLQSTGQGTLPDATVAVAQLRVNRGNVTFNTVGVKQINAGLNGNNNPLFNIFVFAQSSGSLNLAGNTTNSTCSGASCATGPGIYTMNGL